MLSIVPSSAHELLCERCNRGINIYTNKTCNLPDIITLGVA